MPPRPDPPSDCSEESWYYEKDLVYYFWAGKSGSAVD